MPKEPEEGVVPADDQKVLAGDEKEELEPEKDEEKEEEEEEEEKEEGEEKEEKVEGEEETEPDLGPRRPSFREIKEKYPNLFKDFPDLREAFFRESEYTKVFPTVDDAREAVEELESLAVIRDKVLEGDISTVFETAKEADVTTFNKLVEGLLPALYKLDQDAFMRAIGPSIENLVRTACREGKSSGNEDLENSALHISKWFFGDEDIATGKTTTVRKANEPSPEAKKLESERAEFEATKFRDALQSVVVERDAVMEKLIIKGLGTDEELTPYIRKKLVKDILEEVDKQLQQDGSHMSLMNAKWRRAKREGYSKDSLQGVVSTYQARAKSLIPSVRAKLKDEALGKVSGKKAQHAAEVEQRKEVPVGASASRGARLPSPKAIDWNATSDEDILAGNIKTRR